MIRFVVTLTTVTLLIVGLAYLSLDQQWVSALPSFFYPTIILLAFSTVVIYRYLYRIKEPAQFTQFYLLLMVVKLAAYLGYNILMVLEDRKGAMANVVFFLILYFVFTIIEIAFLYRIVTAKTPTEIGGKNF